MDNNQALLHIQDNLNRVHQQMDTIITNNYMNQEDTNTILNMFNLIMLSIHNLNNNNDNINIINNLINNQQELINHIINNDNNNNNNNNINNNINNNP
uniref:Uncharacterized protein n=1 Tax=viral metagenome TaxID=1070528 RepID=A0A6C0C5K4_9ZZZZ